MKSIAFWCVCVAFCLIPARADAQLCLGAPSFSSGPYQVSVGATFSENAQGVGGGMAAGGSLFFGGVGISVLNHDALDATSMTISAKGGAELQADANRRIFICPVAELGFGVGPDIGPIDVTRSTLSGGGSVGVVASDTDDLMVVPTFGLSAAYSKVRFDLRGTETSDSDGFGTATIGVGLIFNRHIGITPALLIPFSVPESDVIFSLTFAFNFGS